MRIFNTGGETFLFFLVLTLNFAGCAMAWESNGSSDGGEDVFTESFDDGGNPCAGVTCSGHGRCLVEEGRAVCECDDGFVPAGMECLPVSDRCGNGIVDDPAEDCDPPDMGLMTCEALGYGPGTLSCKEDCTYDTSSCGGSRWCGDGECASDETSCSCPADCEPCAGCCDGIDCLPGNENSACGSGGAPCQVCPAETSCVGGACLESCGDGRCDSDETQCTCPADCGTCTGCCQAGVCMPGTDVLACGTSGEVCDVCSSSEACIGGRCQGGCGNGVCGTGETRCNCPFDCGVCSGCCDGDICLSGNSNSACGSGGNPCQVCGSGETCTGGSCLGGCGNGVCGPDETQCNCPTDCGLCSGCCQGTTCMPGNTDSACGSGGVTCDVCSPSLGETCSGGSCIGGCGNGVCGPGETQCNCPTDCGACSGCCNGDSCESGTSNSACGAGGENCEVCTGGRVCSGGDCVCLSHDHTDCYLDELYWFDSCGNPEELYQECLYGCSGGACITDCHSGSSPGDDNYCRVDCQCDEREGDCDSDSECSGALSCADNIGQAFGWSSTTDVCSHCGNDPWEWNQTRAQSTYIGEYYDNDSTTYYIDGEPDIWPSSDNDWYSAHIIDTLFGIFDIDINLSSLSTNVDICATFVCDSGTLNSIECNSTSDWQLGSDTCCSTNSGSSAERILMHPYCASYGDGYVYVKVYGVTGEQCGYYLTFHF